MAQQPPSQPPPQAPPPAAGGTGLQPNIASLLAYLFLILGGIVFLIIEKDNREVKFNAWQSIAFGVAWIAAQIILTILSIIFSVIHLYFLSTLLGLVVGLGFLIVWIMLMVRAYQGQIWRLPVIGDFAANQAGI
jgi:uncharacterized membrane protein